MMSEDERKLFEKLRKKREKLTELFEDPAVKNALDFSDIYSDSAHFVYELLQNADDCGATHARFILNSSSLIFAHNGERHFTLTDVDNDRNSETSGDINAITSLVNSNKKDKQNKIGKFGAGFKAVFTYTNTPYIYDTTYKFYIEEKHIVPHLLEEDLPERNEKETLFLLPFNNPNKSPEYAYKEIANKLQSLSNPLLFLSHLKEIKYEIGENKGCYSKEIHEDRQFDDVTAELICCVASYNQDLIQDSLWLFSNTDEKENKYSVGFFLEVKDGETHLKSVDMPAFCFFPTKETTGLHYIIQAPFLLTSNRENIKSNEEHNKKMLRLLGDLASKSIVFLKKIGEDEGNRLVDDHILSIIPYKKPYYSGSMWAPFYEDTKKIFETESVLPSRKGYTSKPHAYWAVSSRMAYLFSNGQLEQLCGDPQAKWVFPSIGRDTHRSLTQYGEDKRDFIDDVTCYHPSEADILDKITAPFIEAQSIEWLIQFYKWVDEDKDRRRKAKRLPIFLDQHHKAVAAFDKKDQEILFIPSANIDGDDYCTLSQELWNIEDLKEFFGKLGLHEPLLKDHIYHKILPLYQGSDATSISVEKADRHFKLFFDYYCSHRDLEFVSLIKDCSFLTYCDRNGVWHRARANELYFPTPELQQWFLSEARFFPKEKYEKIVGKEKESLLEDFLKNLGIKTEISIRYKLATPENRKWKGTLYNIWLEPYIDGLEGNINLLQTLNEREEIDDAQKIRMKEEKKLLCTTLERLLEQTPPSGWYRPPYSSRDFTYGGIYRFPSGEHHWLYYIDRWEPYESVLQRSLRKIAWMFTTENGYFNSEIMDGSPSPKLLELFGIDQKPHEQHSELRPELIEQAEKEGIDVNELLKEAIAKKKEGKGKAAEEQREREDPKKTSDQTSPDNNFLQNADRGKAESSAIFHQESPLAHSVPSPQTSYSDIPVEPNPEDCIEEWDDVTLSPQSLSRTLENKQQKIQGEIDKLQDERERLKEMYEKVSRLQKYSFGWFKALLSLEKEGQKQTANGREISITFASVKRDPKSDRSFILSQPNRYIPTAIEDKSNIPLNLFMQDGKKRSPEIEVVSVRGNTLRVKAKNEDQLKGIDFSKVTHAIINVQNPDFLLESLDGEFQNLDYPDEFDMQQHLCENIEFLVGPPGTGKTTYLAEHLKTLMEEGEIPCKVLVLTPTNKAADVLVRKIMEISGEDNSYDAWLARIGITEDEEVETSPVFREKALDARSMSKCVAVTTIARYSYDALIPEKGGTQRLNEIDWDYIVVDEASMIPLADIVFLLYKQKPKKFVIAGDPFQIEPIVSQEAWKDANIYSLVKLDSFDHPSTIPHPYKVETLNTQYRSIPEIGDVFSNFAYGGKLAHFRTSSKRKNLHLEDLGVRTLNIIKYPVRKYESIYRAKRLQNSPYQVYSALLTVEYIRFLADEISRRNPGQGATIGVISPYRAQGQIIDRLLSRETLPDGIKVTSGTVHKFQGDECDIIFAVFNAPANLSNPDNTHINKKNIINVAVSRARDYLFAVIPDDNTENVENLKRIKRIESLMERSGDCSVMSADEIEQQIFGRSRYLENNIFSTGHQDVNVYDRPEKMYEIRTEDDAVDIQLHSSGVKG